MTPERSDSDWSWFYTLDRPDQAALLRSPHRPLPGPLVQRLMLRPGAIGWHWVDSSDPVEWNLVADASARLDAARAQFDQWWSILTPDERAYLIDNRDGELAAEYGELVLSAGRDPSEDPNAVVVVLVRDNKSGVFRLPLMVRAYVDVMVAQTV